MSFMKSTLFGKALDKGVFKSTLTGVALKPLRRKIEKKKDYGTPTVLSAEEEALEKEKKDHDFLIG